MGWWKGCGVAQWTRVYSAVLGVADHLHQNRSAQKEILGIAKNYWIKNIPYIQDYVLALQAEQDDRGGAISSFLWKPLWKVGSVQFTSYGLCDLPWLILIHRQVPHCVQIEYAALDAACLLGLLEAYIRFCPKEVHLPPQGEDLTSGY